MRAMDAGSWASGMWMLRGLVAAMAATLLLVAPGSAAAAGWTPQAEPGLFATGGSWAQQAIPAEQGPNGRLAAVSCSTSTSCMAVGSFIDPAVEQRATSQVWNGSTWTAKAVPLPAGATRSRLAGVSCTAANACTAVGSYALPRLDNGFTPDQNPLVARWNGTAWALQTVPLPEGTDLAYLNGVSCTATGGCKAVGGYRTGSTGSGALIEHFDGSSWTFRAPPNPAGATAASLNGVSCTGTVCMAVGHYATQTGRLPSRAFAERFDGTGWSEKPVPTPSGATVVNVNGVSCTSATACTAVGGYSTAPGYQEPDKPLASRWDGATWTQQTTPAEPPSVQFRTFLAVSCVTASSCTAVGDDRDTSADAGAGPPLVQHWDGTSWAVQPAPKPSGSGRIVAWFEGVSCTSGGCTAVGASSAQEQTSQATATLAERQTAPDATWRIQDSRNGVGAFTTRAHGVSCASATWCVAVGVHDSPTDTGATIARWDGTGWAAQIPGPRFGSGTLGDFLGGVSCTAANACMAVGAYDESWPEHPALGFQRPLAQRWNGTSWTSTKLPVPADATSTQNVSLVSVACASATACIAVGSNNGTTPLVEHWDGASWTIETVPLPAGTVRSTLNDVSCTAPDACTAVGGYSLDQNHRSEAPLILRWNGTSWTRQIGVAPDGVKYAALTSVSCTPPKPCTAAGEYSTTDYNFGTESLVERWNGTSWAIQAAAYPGLNRVSCPTLTSCTGVGGVSPSQEWDGTSWAFKGPGLVGRQNGVSCTDASECTAVGTSTDGRLLRQNLLAGLQLVQVTVAPTAGRWAEPVVPQSYSIEDESVVEGDGGSGATTMTFTVTRTKTEEAGSVEVRLEPGTAGFPGDFGATASVDVDFAAGAATATVNVPVNGDQAPENDETFTVMTNAGGDDIDGTATGTIVDDDEPVVSVGDAEDVAEGAAGTKEMQFPVTLSAASPKVVQVAYQTEDGSATAGSDYQHKTGTVVFQPGQMTGTVTVTVNGDGAVEADETLRVRLHDPSDAVLGTAAGEGTIVNDDQPAVSIADAPNVAEGAPGATAEMRFPVTLSAASPKAVKVGYRTQDGSATAPADYETKTGALTIPAGQLTGTVVVPVTGDDLVEADETLSVELENPVDATVGTATATGTIVDDDDEPVVSIGNAPDVQEGAAGATAELRFPVTLSAPSPIAVTVDYRTEDGSATAPSDYQATAGTLTIPAGEVTATVVVTVVGDGNVEPDESFGVRLETPVDVIVGTAAAQGRIGNDDTAPPPPPGPSPSPSPSPSPGPGPGAVPVAPPFDVVGPVIQIPSANKALTATASGAVPFALGPMAEDTTGVISIKTDGKVSAARAAAKKKILALGSKAFQALKGQRIVVKVRLSGAGRKLLKKRKKIKAQANITLRDGRGNATVKAYRFTIKAPKKRAGR